MLNPAGRDQFFSGWDFIFEMGFDSSSREGFSKKFGTGRDFRDLKSSKNRLIFQKNFWRIKIGQFFDIFRKKSM